MSRSRRFACSAHTDTTTETTRVKWPTDETLRRLCAMLFEGVLMWKRAVNTLKPDRKNPFMSILQASVNPLMLSRLETSQDSGQSYKKNNSDGKVTHMHTELISRIRQNNYFLETFLLCIAYFAFIQNCWWSARRLKTVTFFFNCPFFYFWCGTSMRFRLC